MPEDESFLRDETSPENGNANLRLALEAYPTWLERLGDRSIKTSFLASCSTTVPFYRRLFGGRVCRDLDQFPISDRTVHDTRRREFISTSFDDPRSDQLSIHTNGTFSPSLRVSLDLPSLFELNHASYLRFAGVLPTVLAKTVPARPTVFVISDSSRDQRTSLVLPGLNATILRRLILGRGEESDAALVRYLRRARIALLHGKPSVLARLVDLDQALSRGARAQLSPASITCSGENLYPDDRARLETWFGCGIVEAYVASETGMVALECVARVGMHVLADHLTVEVLASDGRPRSAGSGELLVTNALNWRHAFIRYRIGDRATVIDGECRCGHDGQTIVALPGRDRASYGTPAAPIAAEQIDRAIAEAGVAVKQYQVAPGIGHEVVISWIPAVDVDVARGATAISASLRRCIPGMAFELRRVSTINTPGGKLRRFL